MLLLVDPDYGDALEISGEVIRYHLERGLRDSLTSRPIRLLRDPDRYALQISGFANEADAHYYAALLDVRLPDFMRERMVRAAWPISRSNFARLYRSQVLAPYWVFAHRRYHLSTPPDR